MDKEEKMTKSQANSYKNFLKKNPDFAEKRRESNTRTAFADPITGEEMSHLESELGGIELPSRYVAFLKVSKGGQVSIPGGTIFVYGFGKSKSGGGFGFDRTGDMMSGKYFPFHLYFGQAGVSRVDDGDDLVVGNFTRLDDEGDEISKEYFTADSHYLDKAMAAAKKFRASK